MTDELDKNTDEADKSERIKLALEYVKIALTTVGLASLILGVLQWRSANQLATEELYRKMANEWRDHIKTFVDKPELRPYFEDKRLLSADDKNTQAVLAVADVRLDVMDAILTYVAMHGYSDEIAGWKMTFSRAFKTSPILCARLAETKRNYGLIVPIGMAACSNEQK